MESRHPRRAIGSIERVVYDEPTRCPYLPGRLARLPLRLPGRSLSGEELSDRLNSGDRRQGHFLYRPACPACQACEAIRVDTVTFRPSKTQRRVFRRGEASLETVIDRPSATPAKIALYNRHKIERGLVLGHDLVDASGYEEFLVASCADTIELSYHLNGKLIGVALADRAADALSAVYCFFDPAYQRLSPGVYSVLKQVALCRYWGLPWLYLGLYIADCPSMSYKARYVPHERLIAGAWHRFEDSSEARAGS